MANIFLNLPMPAGDGPGTPVDTSAMGKEKSIVVGGAFEGATVAIEVSEDGAEFQPVHLFSFADKKVIPVAAQSMRVNVLGRSNLAFSATADIGANDNGALFVALPLPAGDGAGASVDVSALGNFTTFVVGGEFPGVTISIEISEDGTEFAACGTSFADLGSAQSKVVVANFMRTFVRGRSNLPFTPVVSVGATNDAGGVDLSSNNVWTAGQSVAQVTLATAANVAVNGALSNNFEIELDQNIILDAPSGVVAGTVLNFAIRQNATGGRTVTFNAAYKFTGGAPVISPLANEEDLVSCYVRSVDGGGNATSMSCSITQDVVV